MFFISLLLSLSFSLLPIPEHSGSGPGSSQNYPASGSSQGNLYYFPVGDKQGREHTFQASPNNQFNGASGPNGPSSVAGAAVNGEVGEPLTPLESAPSGDLAFSAQELNFANQGMPHDIARQPFNYGNGPSASSYNPTYAAHGPPPPPPSGPASQHDNSIEYGPEGPAGHGYPGKLLKREMFSFFANVSVLTLNENAFSF